MYFDFSSYTYLDWLFLILGVIALFIQIPLVYRAYRLSRTRIYLMFFIFATLGVIVTLAAVRFDNPNILQASMLHWSNRIIWIFLYLIGFELLEKSDKRIPKWVKMPIYIFSALTLFVTALALYVFPTQSDILVMNFYFQHSHQIIANAVFTYCVLVMKTIDSKNARRSRKLWIFFGSTWTIAYIINFYVLLNIGGLEVAQVELAFAIVLIFSVMSFLIINYLAIFMPENLLITLNQIFQAQKLYKTFLVEEEEEKFNFTKNHMKEYLLNIPDDVWKEAGVKTLRT